MSKSYVGMTGCVRCGKPLGVILDRRLKDTFEEGQVYNSGEMCDECKEEEAKFAKIVSEGGIFFRCSQCETVGVIALSDNTRPLIEYVRKQAHHDDPDWMTKPCGVEFAKCYMHGAGDPPGHE